MEEQRKYAILFAAMTACSIKSVNVRQINTLESENPMKSDWFMPAVCKTMRGLS
jgi:hypothetical protein